MSKKAKSKSCETCGGPMTDVGEWASFCDACLTKCERCRHTRDKHTRIGDVWICPTAIFEPEDR